MVQGVYFMYQVIFFGMPGSSGMIEIQGLSGCLSALSANEPRSCVCMVSGRISEVSPATPVIVEEQADWKNGAQRIACRTGYGTCAHPAVLQREQDLIMAISVTRENDIAEMGCRMAHYYSPAGQEGPAGIRPFSIKVPAGFVLPYSGIINTGHDCAAVFHTDAANTAPVMCVQAVTREK